MKKQILITVVLSILFHWAFAQNSAPADNLNLSLMDKYTGTWEWKSDNSSFKLVLKRKQIAAGVYLINGWYRYIKDGQLIIDKLDKVDSMKHSALSGYVVNGKETLTIIFSDETRNISKRGSIYFVNGDQNKILIQLNSENHPSGQFQNKGRKVYSDTIPKNLDFVLTRE